MSGGVFKLLPLCSCFNGECTWLSSWMLFFLCVSFRQTISKWYLWAAQPGVIRCAQTGRRTEQSTHLGSYLLFFCSNFLFWKKYFSLFFKFFACSQEPKPPNALCTLLLVWAFGYTLYALAVHDSFTHINETPRWHAEAALKKEKEKKERKSVLEFKRHGTQSEQHRSTGKYGQQPRW